MSWTPVPEGDVPGPDATLANLTKQTGDPEVGYISPADVSAAIDALLNRLYYLEQRVAALEGASRIHTYSYTLASSTTEGANSGQVRLDNADQQAALTLWASVEDSGGTDWSLVWVQSPNTAEVYLQDRNDATKWQRYRATNDPAYVVKGNYVEVAVQWLEGGAPVPTGAILAATKAAV